MNTDRINELYAGKIFSPEVQNSARERIHWICKQVRGKRILDMGCSQGIISLLLAREGFHCVGIDREKSAIGYALDELEKEEEAVRKKVEFKVGDAAELWFEDGSFDTVILGEILEHLNHPERILKEAKRVLKQDGLAIITVPFGLNPDPDHKRTYYPIPFFETVYPFFKTNLIETIDSYILYSGVKENSYDVKNLSRETLLAEELRLQIKTEERLLTKENELFAKSIQFNEKVKTFKEQLSALSKTNKDLKKEMAHKDRALEDTEREFEAKLLKMAADYKDALAVKEKEKEEVQARTDRALEDTEREFEAKLGKKERACQDAMAKQKSEIEKLLKLHSRELESKLHKKEIEYHESLARNRKRVEDLQVEKNLYRSYHFEKDQIFKSSLTWRIGSAIIVPFIIITDLVKHPTRFCKEPGAHFRRVYFHHYPRSKPLLRKNGSTISGLPANIKAKQKHNKLSTEKNDVTREADKQSRKKPAKQKISAGCTEHNPISTFESVTSHLYPKEKAATKDLQDMTIACIMDEFSSACFGEEANLIHITPDNWKDVLENRDIDMLFVESAWYGYKQSWYEILAYMNKTKNHQLIMEITSFARKKGLPTAFWNKEDPPHYEVFKKAASHFDFVFTSDSNMIDKYCKDLRRSQVYSLPFAAQPVIHNPIGKIEEPGKDLFFAGAWYNHHKDRILDYERVLEPALKFDNFHIYDRMFDNPKRSLYRYPEKYDACILGCLPYEMLLKEYKRYKVFLNINSVHNSPTMFSRRVYEVMLCGTPVISGYALGIERQLGGDLVRLVRTPEEGLNAMQELINDTELRSDIGRKGIRRVMEGHKYEDRIQYILDIIGLQYNKNTEEIAVWSLVKNKNELLAVLDNIARQRFDHKKINFYLGVTDSSLISTSPIPEKTTIIYLTEKDNVETALQAVLQRSCENYITFFDPVVFYGPFYLMDQAHALKYSGCRMVGKASFISYDGTINIKYKGLENQIFNAVECDLSTAIFERSLPILLKNEGDQWLIQKANLKWYSGPPHGLIKLENRKKTLHSKIGSLSEFENWLS